MAIVVPTITATEPHEYREQMETASSFAQRIHIDLMDGIFAPTKSPDLEQCWWPENTVADVHLMYQRPMEQIEALLKLKPSLVVIHAEAEGNHTEFASKLNEAGIRAGIALLAESAISDYTELFPSFDHVLVFSGKLGYHGGVADVRLLSKVSELREKFPHLEVAWDGGINAQNARDLAGEGVQVLNVGGFIQNSATPAEAFKQLVELVN